jgi:hypothetical protein
MIIKSLIKYLIKLIGFKLVRIKKYQEIKYHESSETYGLNKINYGCYRNYLKDWLNVDRDIEKSDIFKTAKVNLTQKHPFHDETFAYGFAEDFIACIQQSELIIFLYEVYRTFRSGGVLRISTPGLEGVLNKHYSDSNIETALLAKTEAYDMWGNILFPSFHDLEMICKHIGFSGIRKVEYGISDHAELNNLDTRTHQIGLNTYVEITK